MRSKLKLLAQGFVQAQDRLFQMELWRRSTRGRLAETFGDAYVEKDRGDGFTVNATGGSGWPQSSGASFREILALSDWDRSLVTTAPGESGQPGSPHFGDFLPVWGEGRYVPLAFSRARVEELAQHRLRLVPAVGGEATDPRP